MRMKFGTPKILFTKRKKERKDGDKNIIFTEEYTYK